MGTTWFFYISRNGRKVSNNPWCGKCSKEYADANRGSVVVLAPATQNGGQCIACGTVYENRPPESGPTSEQEAERLERLYRDYERSFERRPF